MLNIDHIFTWIITNTSCKSKSSIFIIINISKDNNTSLKLPQYSEPEVKFLIAVREINKRIAQSNKYIPSSEELEDQCKPKTINYCRMYGNGPCEFVRSFISLMSSRCNKYHSVR